MPISHTGLAERQSAETQDLIASPETGALERFLPSLIFLSCLAYLYIFRRYSGIEPDEGIVLQGAERVLAGQLPYRDFFSFYTPGSFYLIAGLFRVFGDSFAVARISLAVVGAICSVLTYVLARRVCSWGIALFAAVLATTAGTAFRFLVLHNPYSTLGSCLCVYAAVRFLETRKSVWAFATTSLASLTFLIEQSKGGGLYLGLALGFVILWIVDRSLVPSQSALFLAAIGVLWPMATTFAYFGGHHSANVMVQSWLWPLHHYSQANHVPYGYQNWSDHTRDVIFHTGSIWLRVLKITMISPGLFIPILPLMALGLLGYWTVRLRSQSHDFAEARYYVLVCAVLTGLLASVVIGRADILHFMYLAPLWYVVLAWILGGRAVVSGKALNALRVPLVAFVTVSFGLLSMAVLFSTTGAKKHIDTRRGVIVTSAKETVIEYVQAHVGPRSGLLVYPYLPLYNYLTETHSPAGYDYFQPGMNTPEQAGEIIDSLKTSHAPILFESDFAEKIAGTWPGTSMSAIVKDPVSDYIAANYRICKVLSSADNWRFQFMVKTETRCP
jgi:4-amino-4-deoxy-L-arabinose transferase-like glycosyltransferase